MMLYEQFLERLPFHFRTTKEGRNKNFHKLLKIIFDIGEFYVEKLNEIRINTFSLNTRGSWLDFIASNIFGISRGIMTDDELLFAIYFSMFLKNDDASNKWILQFVKKVINPIDCFFIHNDLEMIFYFELSNPLTPQQISLLHKLKDNGVVSTIYYTINKKIATVPKYEVLPLYANGMQMDYNIRDAVTKFKANFVISGKPPLEEAYFYIIESEEPLEVSQNFIKV